MWWILLLIVLPAILAGAFVAWKARPRGGPSSSPWAISPDSDTEFARGIRFLGVQPFGSDDLLDANGRKVGELPNLGADPTGGNVQLHRSFIFEYPLTEEPVHFQSAWLIRPAGQEFSLGGSSSAHYVQRDGTRLLIQSCSFQDYYMVSGLLSSHRVPFDRVDLALSFFHGPPREAEVSFTGPFEVGKDYSDDKGRPCTLSFPADRNRANQVAFHFAATVAFHQSGGPWMAFDLAGRRHVINPSGGGSSGSRGATLDYSFPDPPLAQIGRLICGEKPETRTFRSVLVRYAGRAERTYPGFYDRIAAALGCTAQEARQRGNFTPGEAVRVAALARGEYLSRLRDALSRLKFADLPPDEQKRLQDLALAWAQSEEYNARGMGMELGMKWGAGERLFPIIVRWLNGTEHNARIEAASALIRAESLTAGQIAWIKDRLLSRHERYISQSLMEALRRRRTPPATEALWELAKAPEDQVRLWWPAIEALSGREALGDRAKLDKELGLRVAVGVGPASGDGGALPAATKDLLGRLLTPKLAREDGGVYMRVRQEVLRRLDRQAATAALVGFLRQVQPADREDDDCRRHLWQEVKQLNLWHNQDFGSLGWDAREAMGKLPDLSKHDWQGTIATVLKWHEAGGGREARPAWADPTPLAEKPAVGQAVERVITGGDNGELSRIDLDSGELYGIPLELRYGRGGGSDLSKKREAWQEKLGVDATAYAGRDEATLNFTCPVVPFPAQLWGQATPDLAEKALAGGLSENRQAGTSPFGGTPATYAFRTARGALGVMAITQFSPDPGRVTIRYKLLASPPAESPASDASQPEAP